MLKGICINTSKQYRLLSYFMDYKILQNKGEKIMANTNDMNTPTKVPCGGFVLGEGLALSKDGKTLNVTGGGSSGGLFKVTITGTANESNGSYKYMSDKTGKEVYDAYMNGLLPYAEVIVDGELYFGFIPCVYASDQYETQFIGVATQQSTNNNGKILVSFFALPADRYDASYSAHILNSSVERNCEPLSTLFD